MPRNKKSAASTEAIDGVDTQKIQETHQRHGDLVTARDAQLSMLDSRFALDMPYDYETYVAHARGIVTGMGAQLFELGRVCLLIKEHEDHGQFTVALERIGVAPRFAQKCMAAVFKFENGGEGRQMLASRLSSAKLLELMGEDDADLDVLGEGGTLAGYELDEIASMSTKALREALRKERQEHADELSARDEIIDRKDKKLRDLEVKTRKASKSPLRDQADGVLTLALERLGELLGSFDNLRLAVDEVIALHNDAGEDVPADIAAQLEHVAETVTNRARDIAEIADI